MTRELVSMGVFASTLFYFLPAVLLRFAPTLPFISMANNPAILATSGIIAGWIVVGIGLAMQPKAVEEEIEVTAA